MSTHTIEAARWLPALVLVHLAVALVHGGSHAAAHVTMSTAGNQFMAVVIIGGPLVGLAVMRRADRIGRWTIAAAMAGSLAFGVVNHFVVASSDHVSMVDPRWRPLFTTTAVLLATIEALGTGLAIAASRKRSWA